MLLFVHVLIADMKIDSYFIKINYFFNSVFNKSIVITLFGQSKVLVDLRINITKPNVPENNLVYKYTIYSIHCIYYTVFTVFTVFTIQ